MSRFGGYADVLGDFIEGYPSGDWGPGGFLKWWTHVGPNIIQTLVIFNGETYGFGASEFQKHQNVSKCLIPSGKLT
jgi:hypothetical protein